MRCAEEAVFLDTRNTVIGALRARTEWSRIMLGTWARATGQKPCNRPELLLYQKGTEGFEVGY